MSQAMHRYKADRFGLLCSRLFTDQKREVICYYMKERNREICSPGVQKEAWLSAEKEY